MSEMKSKDDLIAMCEGYLEGLLACNADLYDWRSEEHTSELQSH